MSKRERHAIVYIDSKLYTIPVKPSIPVLSNLPASELHRIDERLPYKVMENPNTVAAYGAVNYHAGALPLIGCTGGKAWRPRKHYKASPSAIECVPDALNESVGLKVRGWVKGAAHTGLHHVGLAN